MPQTLPITLVAPKPLNDAGKIGMLLGTAETAFQANGRDVQFDVEINNNFMSASRHLASGQITGFDITKEQLVTMAQHCLALIQDGV